MVDDFVKSAREVLDSIQTIQNHDLTERYMKLLERWIRTIIRHENNPHHVTASELDHEHDRLKQFLDEIDE